MCMLKSGLILKDDVFIPDYDSHEKMIKELELKDDGQNTNFIRATLSPPYGDIFAPVDTWKLEIDQDILPKWYVAKIDNERFIAAMREWVKKHIIIGGVVDEIKDGVFFVKDATIKNVYDNATINYVCGNATIKNVYGNATINYVYDNATINYVYDNATINYVYDNATINYVYGNATINYVCGNATIITYKTLDSSIADDALIIDRVNKVIYHSSNFKKEKRS